MTAWEVMEGDTEEDFSGAKSFLDWNPPLRSLHHPLLSSCGEMDGESQGWDRPLRNDGFGP